VHVCRTTGPINPPQTTHAPLLLTHNVQFLLHTHVYTLQASSTPAPSGSPAPGGSPAPASTPERGPAPSTPATPAPAAAGASKAGVIGGKLGGVGHPLLHRNRPVLNAILG
jgi:hypothetical protein